MILDRRVQVLRATLSDNGFEQVETFAPVGGRLPVNKRDVSDAEKFRSGQVQSNLHTRFVARWSAFVDLITPRDKLLAEGSIYEIVGIKEIGGRRKWVEISCALRNDLLGAENFALDINEFSSEFSEEFS